MARRQKRVRPVHEASEETGKLEAKMKGTVGRKLKVNGAVYKKFRAINRKHEGDKTFGELAVLFRRANCMKVSHTTHSRTAKREKWQTWSDAELVYR